MIDERTKQMIETYLPNPPDPELNDGEYYYLQSTMKGEQVIKVYPLDIFPVRDGTEYGIYQNRGGQLRWVDVGYGEHTRGCRKHDLYDNKQDCKDSTHYWDDNWERLREIQRKEGLI
jgi:hypothetical protein